jgi:hypothetical protein
VERHQGAASLRVECPPVSDRASIPVVQEPALSYIPGSRSGYFPIARVEKIGSGLTILGRPAPPGSGRPRNGEARPVEGSIAGRI